MSLEDDLLEIRGVGEATAEEIIAVVDAECVDSEVAENVRVAYDYLADGQEHQAHSYLRRAYEEL